MKWENTIASQCRYAEIAEKIFGKAEIIWECSENDYQGYVDILCAFPDGTYGLYYYSYGSCSGCDGWESSGLSDEEIEKEMRQEMTIFTNKKILEFYLKLTEQGKVHDKLANMGSAYLEYEKMKKNDVSTEDENMFDEA